MDFADTQPQMEARRRASRWPLLLVLVITLLAAYWYWSPYIALRQLRAAVVAGDADAISEYVDYAALRESMKAQLMAKVAPKLEETSSNPFAAMGAALGMAMANQMIDNLVSPSVLMAAIREGRMRSGSSGAEGQPIERVGWKYKRIGLDRLIAIPIDQDTNKESPLELVFRRRGFSDWKLIDMRLNL